ncbi:peptide ABC transporter substrate-binding protein [Labrys miyagiensis]|uniref:Peptide ABC transporter substrate-binding protein n=1 Tax=Labrys miyagiensis TaxID=346912 RepID=A0ABQ6CCL4_9HYPH|nr:ABC transporter substrate-binding protein [Labrys miyagiensis]GLS17539.1 peptide ABC transporter substrate-binding protein [Labrys miyagiensis]
MISRRTLLMAAAGLFATPALAVESTLLGPLVAAGKLPPQADRLPKQPLVADMLVRKRTIGQYGGDMRTLVAKPKDLRYLTVMGYTRLVGYDETLNLKPDILVDVVNEGDRSFTFVLREGHRWSDGAPFTTDDFRFYWEEVALDAELTPAGPPAFMVVDGEPPKVEILDATHVRYSWSHPNPRFLPSLAGPRPEWIYTPVHYMKQFHKKYGDMAKLTGMAKSLEMNSWAALYNQLDDPYGASNPDMPTLDPWWIRTKAPSQQFIFERNPYFHRVDPQGQQLPYIDRIVANVAATGLFAAKANAGEVDLLYRGLNTGDIPMLKGGEAWHKYHTLAWQIARGSAFALYPNLTCNDPVWRALNRDVRFRRALSLSIDRHVLNNTLYFRRGIEGNNTMMPESALHSEEDRKAWATFDPKLASQLLDEAGLDKREGSGTRLLPDGRLAELIVEVSSEASDIIDALEITSEFWADVGIKMVIKAEDSGALNKRAYAGQTVMVASQGLDNAYATAVMPPTELAPLKQEKMAWPKWGQYAETAGKAGEKVDMPEAQQLLDLYSQWMNATTLDERTNAWRDLLRIHADQQFVIGTVQGALQPIVVTKTIQNIPKKAIFSWEPTANLGAYRVDEFYYEQKTAQADTAP